MKATANNGIGSPWFKRVQIYQGSIIFPLSFNFMTCNISLQYNPAILRPVGTI